MKSLLIPFLALQLFLVGCASKELNPMLAESYLTEQYDKTGKTTVFLHVKDDERLFECDTWKSILVNGSYYTDSCKDWFADFPKSRYRPFSVKINDKKVGDLYHNNMIAVQLSPGRYYLDYERSKHDKQWKYGLWVGLGFDIHPGVHSVLLELEPFGFINISGETKLSPSIPSAIDKPIDYSSTAIPKLTSKELSTLHDSYIKKAKRIPIAKETNERRRRYWAAEDARQSSRMWNAAASGLVSGISSASRSYAQHQQDLRDIDNIYIETIAPNHNRRHASSSNIHVEYDDGSAERERIRTLDEELANRTEKQRIENEKLAEKNRREHKAKMDAYHEELRRSEQEAKKGLSDKAKADNSKCDEYNSNPNNKVWCY